MCHFWQGTFLKVALNSRTMLLPNLYVQSNVDPNLVCNLPPRHHTTTYLIRINDTTLKKYIYNQITNVVLSIMLLLTLTLCKHCAYILFIYFQFKKNWAWLAGWLLLPKGLRSFAVVHASRAVPPQHWIQSQQRFHVDRKLLVAAQQHGWTLVEGGWVGWPT